MKQFLKKILAFLKRRWKLVLLILVVLFIAYSFIKGKQAAAPKLTFVNPVRKDIVSSITISGRVDAKEKARLRFVAGGKVVYLGAQEGDSVKKWQTIATIDRAALQKQMDQSLNLYMKERYDFEDTQDDIKDRTLDTEEQRSVAKNQIDLENQVLNVEIQNIAIQNTSLSSPFDGVLTVSPTAVAGVQLLATDYFEIVNPETLIFRATIDETDINRIAKGQSTKVILDAYDGEEIDTAISYISYMSSESSSGTVFLLEFPLIGGDLNKYRIGMNGDAVIKIAEKADVLTVPIDAISERDNKVYVEVKADNKEQREDREIKIGLESDDDVEVIEGLSESDLIVLP